MTNLALDPQYQQRGIFLPKKNQSIETGKVVWMPQPKQAEFMRRPEFEALYGGAAGGGKSDALLMEATRQTHNRNYKALILRKTFPELEELIVRSLDLYPKAFPGARYNDNKHVWIFPSGARIYFGSIQHKKDRKKYQGQQYAFIGFDELTHFAWEEYSYLFSRCRSSDPTIRCYIRATTNPGGIGHGWVKQRFISGKIPLQTYVSIINVNGVEYRKTKVFVPATVYDNKKLIEANPDYVASLAMLPEAELRALLGGDWDSFQGQVFTEWRNRPNDTFTWTHVIPTFEPPKEWKRYRSFDFGYAKPFSVAWWAIDFDGRVYRYRELYGWNGTPNTGVKWTPDRIAKEIRMIEDKYEKGNNIIGIADPSIWDASRGESIAETMEKHRVYWEPGDNDRLAGKMQIHYRMQFDTEGKPMMYVMDCCKNFIRTVPDLVYDELDVEDIDTTQEDHIYDEIRYFLMSHPIAPRKPVALPKLPYNPLDSEPERKRYGFIKM